MKKSVFDILESVEETQGTKAKTELLAQHVSNVRLAEVLQLTHDPYVNFYIGKVPKVTPCGADVGPTTSDLSLQRLIDALKQCMTGQLRGNAGRDLIAEILVGMNEREHKWASRIILKKMRLGVGDSTIEKLWPGLLSSFEVALAKEIDWEIKEGKFLLKTPITYPARVEPKWDGFRCIAVKTGGKVTLYARSGRVFERAKKIDAWLEKWMQDGWVLDGELMGEEWNDTASIVSSKKNHKDDSGLKYHVFDCLPLDVWRSHGVSEAYANRQAKIVEVLNMSTAPDVNAPVTVAQGKTVSSEDELLQYYHECVSMNYEGVMIKRLDTSYVFGRSMDVMKLKPIVTYDGVVTEVLEGKEGTKWEGTLSRIRIQLPNAPMLVDGPAQTIVGTGFKDEDRAFLNEKRHSLIGRACEVEGQPPLSEDGKVRFPRFVRWREDWDVSPEVSTLIKQIKA